MVDTNIKLILYEYTSFTQNLDKPKNFHKKRNNSQFSGISYPKILINLTETHAIYLNSEITKIFKSDDTIDMHFIGVNLCS